MGGAGSGVRVRSIRHVSMGVMCDGMGRAQETCFEPPILKILTSEKDTSKLKGKYEFNPFFP